MAQLVVLPFPRAGAVPQTASTALRAITKIAYVAIAAIGLGLAFVTVGPR